MRMLCNKLGTDGSGKANLVRDPDGIVWGVLWSFSASAWPELDRVEPGYRRVRIEAESSSGERFDAETYVSSHLAPNPVPLESYKRWLEEGAREHGLPPSYIALLEALPFKSPGS